MKTVIDVPEQLIRRAEHALNKISAEGKYIKKEEALLAVDDALKKCFVCFDKYDT